MEIYFLKQSGKWRKEQQYSVVASGLKFKKIFGIPVAVNRTGKEVETVQKSQDAI